MTKTISLLIFTIFISLSAISKQSMAADERLPALAPIEKAITFARVKEHDNSFFVVVVEASGTDIHGIKLKDLTKQVMTPLEMLEALGFDQVVDKVKSGSHLAQTYSYQHLIMPHTHLLKRHIALGANYAEHAQETDLKKVFMFPKISSPTAPHSMVDTSGRILLDYEAEIGVRFSRAITTMDDFEKGYMALFVCGDYTDRALQLREFDSTSTQNGKGFTDAKSGPGRMPLGEFLVVPKNWKEFLKNVNLRLYRGQALKQNDMASNMIMPIDKIVETILKIGKEKRWLYQGKNISLIDSCIEEGQIILTGTPAGVIFKAPTLMQKILGGIKCTIKNLSFDVVPCVKENIIKRDFREKNYLQPQEKIVMQATFLGKSFQTIGLQKKH